MSDSDTAVPDGGAPGGELRALTGLRIVAAVWVVVFHFHFTPLPGVEDVSAVLGPLATQGALGVDLFFVLSGFVIAYTHLDRLGTCLRVRGAARFVWARAGRMWPVYLVVFHVFGIWLWIKATYGTDEQVAFQAVQPDLTVGAWLQQLFLVQMWGRPFLDGSSWVGPTWSISAEWLAYLLFPLTALVFFRLRRLPAAVLGVGAVLAMAPMAASFLVLGTPYYPFSWLVRVLCGFSAGVLTLLAVRRLTRGNAPSARLCRVASVTATLALVGIVVGLFAGDRFVGVAALLFPVLVGALALADRGPARLLASRPMVHGGRISYALYLIHIPVLEVFWTVLSRGQLDPSSWSTHLIALGVLVLPLGLAHLLYTYLEQPARGWMRDLPGMLRRRPAAVVLAGPAAPAQRRGPAPVDNDIARLDPPTLRTVVVPTPSLPRQTDSRVEVPRQDGAASVAATVARLHAARDAGHDDMLGDGLAGNLMAAARLRSTASDPRSSDRATQRSTTVRAASAVLTEPVATGPASAPEPREATPGGSRTGAERCGRRSRHRAHGSAATPIVATAAASTRGRRRPSHGLHHRED